VDYFDAVIVGAGQAGVPLARDLAGAGWKTALVERAHVGGTCYNEGCTPSKTMAASARVAYLARRAGDYGVSAGPVAVDMAAVRQRKRDLVESWRSGSERRLRGTAGLELIFGEGSFAGPDQVVVRTPGGATRMIETPHVFINTGARPAVPQLPGLELVPYLDSTSVMELDAVPEHLLVLGGGYVALEFAQMFRRFGSEVTVVQRRDRVLPREDADVAEGLTAILREDGVEVLVEAQAVSVQALAAGRVRLELTASAGTLTREGSHLLVATGRVPNSEALDLPAAGLEVDARGFIPVNERLETAVPGIWALGDVNGGPAFTHVSYDDYRIVRDNLLRGGAASTTGRLVPYTVFTDPQLGRVGLSEQEARSKGLDVRVFTMPMDWVARALETNEARGFMKAVVDVETDLILGCAVLGVDGGELMATLEVGMMGGVTAANLREAVFAHPTLTEALNNLFATG
jgi:pyruvate/2-oxoglutarate dehydrogenase complex dihydrolipoamide dehydrogenase (E3) component